jgi:hypothetical protein
MLKRAQSTGPPHSGLGRRIRISLVLNLSRNASLLLAIFLVCLAVGCGGGAGSGGTAQPPPQPQDIPALTTIAPSSAPVGASTLDLVLYGSNFENGATVQWNGSPLSSSWISTTQMTASVPASNFVSAGNAKVTVTNPSPAGGTSNAQTFAIAAAPVATTWVRSFSEITTAQDIVWDAAHGKLYVSIPSVDPTAPNSIVPIDPVNGSAGTPVAAGNNPNRLSISSDSAYLWVGLDGDNAVQRFLLPGLTRDISFLLPLDSFGNTQRPVDLQSAPVNPHTLALVAENINLETGQGVYVYDDATPRPTFVPNSASPGGALIDWIQWARNDATIYASQSITIDAGGVATLNVDPSGVSLASYNGGQVGPPRIIQYDKGNKRLYSYAAAFNPIDGSLIGQFPVALGERTCTADSSLGRYYCFFAIQEQSVSLFELWIYDLDNYALIDRVFFGASAGMPISSVTGSPIRLVRWGNAGLALITDTDIYRGSGGVYLIDGAAVNPNAAPDFSSGTPTVHHPFIVSLAPQQVPVGSPDVDLTIKGNNFTPDSTACWNCNFLQFQFLPTSYVSSQQLNVTIPASLLAKSGQLPITIFDTSSNLFSSNSLSLLITSVPAAGSTTKVNSLDLAGLAMAWDPVGGLLYVGTAEYDGAYPNSIVAVDGNTGSIVKTQKVGSDPDLLSVSAMGQYLYVAYAGSTNMTQLPLPGLESPLTWTLSNPSSSSVYWAGDMKAAPESAHTTAVTLFNLESTPDETGGVVVYDDNVERPQFVQGFGSSVNIYDNVAWGSTDQILTAACSSGCLSNTPVSPLYEFQVSQTGAALLATGTAPFSQGEIHSDFGTGLIYSDDGNVADPKTQAIVGNYDASGLVAPDSSLSRVFILGQTQAQANTNSFTIVSFNQKTFSLVSSITLDNIVGSPIQLARWGNSGLAVLTINNDSGSPGLLYLVQDAAFVSSAQTATTLASHISANQPEFVQRRWKRISKVDIVNMLKAKNAARVP